MKRSTFLAALALCGAMSAGAADGDSQWANYLDGPTSSGVCPLTIDYSDDAVYWLATAGSADGKREIAYNGATLFEGFPSTTTSANHNVVLIKLDKATGAKLFAVYSNSGETYTGQNGVVATPDGGAVVALRMRHAQGYESQPINFVDGLGTNHTIDWSCGGTRYNALIVLKVDAKGAIAWSRLIDVEHPVIDNTEVVASVDLLAVAGDDQGNIYLGGRYVMPIHLPNADGSQTVLTPDNMANFDGDFTQNDNGDLFLIKLDANGYYAGNAANKGIVKKGSLAAMTWADGALYTLGYIKGVEGEKCSLAGHELSPLADLVNVVVAKFDANLQAEWVTLYGSARDANNANVLQNASIAKAGDNLWIGGMGNGSFFDTDANVSVATANKMREGIIFKARASDGHLVAAQPTSAYNDKTSIIGYFGAVQNPAGTGDVWAYGYNWGVTPAPIFMHALDGTTLAYNAEASFDLITGTTTTMYAAAYDPAEGALYYTGRSKGTPAPAGLDPAEKAVNWKGFIGKALLPASLKASSGPSAGIAESMAAPDGITFSVGAGCIVAANGGGTARTVAIYDVAGRQVAAQSVAAGATATIPLPAGLYIAAGRKLLLR